MRTNALIITRRDYLNFCPLGFGIRFKSSRFRRRYHGVTEVPVLKFDSFLYVEMKSWDLHMLINKKYWAWLVSIPLWCIEGTEVIDSSPYNRLGKV